MQFNFPPMRNYFDAVDENCAAHREHPPMLMPLIDGADRLFREDVFHSGTSPGFEIDAFAANLAMSAYTMFLAAVRQALSAHPAPVYPLARSVVEAACYAYIIGNSDDGLSEVWANRHESKDAERASRKAFGTAVSDVAKCFDKDQPEFAVLLREIYQAHIDFGAHPNPKSIIPYLSRAGETEDNRVVFDLGGVYAADGYLANHALLVCAETAMVAAYVIVGAFEKHPLHEKGMWPGFLELGELKLKFAEQLKGTPLPK